MCVACGITIERFPGSFSFQSLNQPDLDDRLPGNTNTSRFTIQRLHNPDRKVDIYALLFLVDTTRSGQIKIVNDVPVA